MANTYTVISPAKGIDGYWYVDANGRDNFSSCHLQFERERGNLRQVNRIGLAETEEEIPEGAFVCWTAFGASLWVYLE